MATRLQSCFSTLALCTCYDRATTHTRFKELTRATCLQSRPRPPLPPRRARRSTPKDVLEQPSIFDSCSDIPVTTQPTRSKHTLPPAQRGERASTQALIDLPTPQSLTPLYSRSSPQAGFSDHTARPDYPQHQHQHHHHIHRRHTRIPSRQPVRQSLAQSRLRAGRFRDGAQSLSSRLCGRGCGAWDRCWWIGNRA